VSLTPYYAAPSLDSFIADADNSLDWLLTRNTDDDGPLSFRTLAPVTLGGVAP
jgi:hypothetical protein